MNSKDEPQEFRPRLRFLFDAILFTDVCLLVLYAVMNLYFILIVALGILLNLLEAALWFAWVRHALKVNITEEEVTGPSEFMVKTTILRSKIDKWKTENLRPSTKKRGYVDIWALDGKRIRLIRPVLGRRQVYIIVGTLLGSLTLQNDDIRKLIVPYPNE